MARTKDMRAADKIESALADLTVDPRQVGMFVAAGDNVEVHMRIMDMIASYLRHTATDGPSEVKPVAQNLAAGRY